MLSVEEAIVTADQGTLPFDVRMVTPGTPEYEEGQAIHAAGQRNLDFYLEHESELQEQFPGPCTLVIYKGCEVRAFADPDDLAALLKSLDTIERSGAIHFTIPEPGVAWIL